MMIPQRNAAPQLLWTTLVLTALLVVFAGCEDGEIVASGDVDPLDIWGRVDISTTMKTFSRPDGSDSTTVLVDIYARDRYHGPGDKLAVKSIKLDGETLPLSESNSHAEKAYLRTFSPEECVACEVNLHNGVNYTCEIYGMIPFELAGWEGDTLRCDDSVEFTIVDFGSFTRLNYFLGNPSNNGTIAATGDVSLPLPDDVTGSDYLSFHSWAYPEVTNAVAFNDTLYQDYRRLLFSTQTILQRQ